MARLPYDPLTLGKLIARVWDDPALRVELIENPGKILGQAGVKVGPNRRVVVHEDTEATINIVIPQRPAGSNFTDDYLRTVGHGMLAGCGDIGPPEA
jgi:hypothetical protein